MWLKMNGNTCKWKSWIREKKISYAANSSSLPSPSWSSKKDFKKKNHFIILVVFLLFISTKNFSFIFEKSSNSYFFCQGCTSTHRWCEKNLNSNKIEREGKRDEKTSFLSFPISPLLRRLYLVDGSVDLDFVQVLQYTP